MRTIKCRKCGAFVDISLGECPVCGAIYYILPESEDGSVPASAAPRAEGAGGTPLPPVRGQGEPRAKQGTWETEEDYTRVFQAPPEQSRKAAGLGATERPGGTGSAGAPKQTRPPAPAKAGRRPRRQTAGFLVGALALIAVLIVLLSVMSGAFDFSDKKVEMPDVFGLSEELARITLDKLGLEVQTQEARSEEAAGTVVGQSIPEGRELEGNETVLLTISAGSGEPGGNGTTAVTVPSVRGYTYEQAKEALEALGLGIIRGEDAYSDLPEGQAIAQDPGAGQQAEKGSSIKVTFSKGEEPAEEFVIAVTVGKGGSVSPRGRVSVQAGESQTFTITPDEGYEVWEIKVDGISVDAAPAYTFHQVTDSHTLYVVFRALPEPTPEPTPDPSPAPTAEPTPTPAAGGGA